MSFNQEFFNIALKLAEKARGLTGINPNVGAVVVKDGKIVGLGHTQECGKNHAEIEALRSAGSHAKGADLYVTLEPCCHHGRTPPCADAIIKAGISRVFAGIEDPNPLVACKGFDRLEEAGITVTKNISEIEVKRQLEVYLTNKLKSRPFFVMKNAVTIDGKIMTETGVSKWITGVESREYVQRLRQNTRVILSGINTVLADDPLFTIRTDSTCQTELRIILDGKLRTPLDAKIVKTAAEIPTMIVKSNQYNDQDKENLLTAKGVEIISIDEQKEGEISLRHLAKILHIREISSVMIEAGSKVSSCFLREKLIDKIYYFIAPKIIGGSKTVFNNLGISDIDKAINIDIESIERTGEDILIVGYPKYQ